MNEQLEFTKYVVTRLESAGIPYMLAGSSALAFYSIPRMTRDIDIVIQCEIAQATKLVRLFEENCYISENSIRDAIAQKSMFNIIHNRWHTKADFIVQKDSEYHLLEFERRQLLNWENLQVWVNAPEDLILSKLEWARESESAMQLRDVKSLILEQTELDWNYLRNWSKILCVEHLLNRVQADE